MYSASLFLVFFVGYFIIAKRVSPPVDHDRDIKHQIGYFFAKNNMLGQKTFKVLTNTYNPVLDFYTRYYNGKGWNIIHTHDLESLQPGDTIVSIQGEQVQALKEKFNIYFLPAPRPVNYFVLGFNQLNQ